MTEIELQRMAQGVWENACEVFPNLVKYDCPKIILNNRLSSTGGRCFVRENKIDLSAKLINKHGMPFIYEVLPHEIGHQIDYRINGWPKNNRWHGSSFVVIGAKLGYNFTTYLSAKWFE